MMVLNWFALSGATDTVSNMASKTLMANFGLNDVTICSLLQVMVTSKNFQNFFSISNDVKLPKMPKKAKKKNFKNFENFHLRSDDHF